MVLTSNKLIVVLQGFVLRPLLYIIHINDLYYAIKYNKVHYFADDANLINFNTIFPLICVGTQIRAASLSILTAINVAL